MTRLRRVIRLDLQSTGKTRERDNGQSHAATSRHEKRHELAPHQIVLRPLVTEKGMHRSTRYNQYAFEVNPLADKEQIKEAVEELFHVRVTQGANAEPQGQAASLPVSLRHDEALEEGDRDVGPEDRIEFF